MLHHYIEEIGQPDERRLVFNSDVCTPTSPIKMGVTWDLSVEKIDDKNVEFTDTVQT